MALWLITDTHFGHNNMVHLCGRPQNFTRLIMDNWRKMVANTDTIIQVVSRLLRTFNFYHLV